MADIVLRSSSVELVPRASVPAAEYTAYKTLRDKLSQHVLGQLEPAIRASTVVSLDALPDPVKFRNQGALDEWRRQFNARDWCQRIWEEWTKAHATCLDSFSVVPQDIDEAWLDQIRTAPSPK